jgi:integrase
LTWADIIKECYEEFIEYLEETGISKNTIGKHIRHLRIMLNASVKEGEQSISDHIHWRALKEISDTTYLTIPEIEKLYVFKPEMVFHERAKDLFIIGCWTGLRVSNLLKINPKTDLSPDEKKLYIHPVKGGDKVLHIPVHPMVLEIFKKYNYELPKMSYAYFFDRAREVIKAAGFTEPFKFKRTVGGKLTEFTVPRCDAIGTHTMRRSFATNMYKIQVPKKIIMDITGHKKEDTFMKYIRISQEESADYLSGVFDKMSSGKQSSVT